ncbi:MAG: CHAD domain-containing protein [Chloroflexi bacterium]|nr:CHAD domain-containing protein [Chloroflexota bacterium]
MSAVPPVADALTASETITRAGARIFEAQFARLRACDDGVRAGDDADAVHDMRVAARRMRSVFRLLGEHYPPAALKGVLKPLRDLARALGAMRDFDVMLEHAERYALRLSEPRRSAFRALTDDWQRQRAEAHQSAIAFLNEDRYVKWERTFEAFLAQAGDHPAPRVCDVVPALIWQHYDAVRRYETGIAAAPIETLHALRIECKRLRYALEFFAPLLGKPAARLIRTTTAAQDHLGQMHDADVRARQIAAFISEHTQDGSSPDARTLNAATAYLHAAQRQLASLQKSAARPYARLVTPAFRAGLARAVARL